MKILVCIKMVPSPDSVHFSPGLNRIVRENVATEMNPSDRMALSYGVSLRDAQGGEVIACTMGPPPAAEVLQEAGRSGADRGVHLVDIRFSGADTLATARALAQLCRTEQPDLVLFGRVAIDGGTAQVPAQVAELAGYPMLSNVNAIEAGRDRLRVRRVDGGRIEEWDLPLPVVISVDPSWTLPMVAKTDQPGSPACTAGPSSSLQASDGTNFPIRALDASGLGGDEAGYGIRGSATYVQKVDEAVPHASRVTIADPGAAAEALWSAAEAADHAAPRARDHQAARRPAGRQLWVLVDGRDGREAISLAAEAIACARQVSERAGAAVIAVVLGPAPDLEAALAAAGADRVLVVRALAAADAGDPEAAYAAVLARLIAARSPIAVIGTWTARGRQCMARAAARLSAGLTGDFVGLDCSSHPVVADAVDLVWLKPAWAGTATARVVARTPVAMGTLRPGAVRPLAPVIGRDVDIEEVDIDIETTQSTTGGAELVGQVMPGVANPTLVSATEQTEATIAPDAARVVICAGAPMAPLFPELRQLASLCGWALGGTAEAARLGLVPARDIIDVARCSLAPALGIGIGLKSRHDVIALRGARRLAIVDGNATSALYEGADLAITCTAGDLVVALRSRASATSIPAPGSSAR